MGQQLLSPPKPKTSSRSKAPGTFYTVKGSADIRWRVELPVRHTGSKLVVMNEKLANKVLIEPNEGGKFPWRETEEGSEYPNHEGTAIWTRPDMTRAVHAASMGANGIRTLAEVDDNYLSKPSQNFFMHYNDYDAVSRSLHMKVFASFDGIIFSTNWLRDEYVKAYRKDLKHKARDVHVCRNHVDPEDWPKRTPLLPEGDGRTRVGWMGSQQHGTDLRLAAPALRLAKDMGCEIVFIGLDPATWDPQWRQFLGDYTHVPWRGTRYHKHFINLDVGLIPLVTNKHTLGKSDVKFLEYSMSGVATVAQSNPVYNNTVIHGETGLLAASPDNMAYATVDLIKNVRYRRELAASAKQWVLEHRTMQRQGVPEWQAALEG